MSRGNLLSRFGGGLQRFGQALATGVDPRIEEQRLLQEQQSRQELGNILSGQSIPAFARAGGAEPSSPQDLRQTQLGQLGALNTPESLNVLSQLSPLMQKASAPLSAAGKEQEDVRTGFITPESGQELLKKRTAPSGPLVTFGDQGPQESAFQEQFGKKRADSISQFVTDQRVKSEQALQALPALDRIEELINEGVVTGALDDIKIALGNVIRGFGGDPAKIEALKDINKLEEVRSLTNNLVIPLAKQLGYNPTDADAKRIESSVAGLGKGPQANKALIGFLRDAAKNTQIIQSFIDSSLESNDLKVMSTLDSRVNKLKRNLLSQSLAKLDQIKITNTVDSPEEAGGKIIKLDENFNIIQ